MNIPEDAHLVGSEWIFTTKYRSDGSIEKYKVRLVVKRFSQKYQIDYLDTFTPVAKMNAVKIILFLPVLKN